MTSKKTTTNIKNCVFVEPSSCNDDDSIKHNINSQLGASPSNTAPPKYINLLRCALDSLYLSFSGRTHGNIDKQLLELKDSAQGNGKGYLAKSEAFIKIGAHQFEVLPKGSGKFAFMLADNWFQISVSSEHAQKMPLAYVQISSELLTFQPLANIISEITTIIEHLGFVTSPPIISRLDLCMDFYANNNFNPADIIDEQWRTRANLINSYSINKKRSGFLIGKGDMVGRLYNKSLEIQSSNKDYLKPLWKDQGWNEESIVWRIEFQFRRELLQSLDVYTMDDFYSAHQSLWYYASSDWLNLVIPNTTDTNASRWPVHPAWDEIINSCSSESDKVIRKVPLERLPSDDILFVTGAGYLISFMAREGITNFIEGMKKFYFQADQYYKFNRNIDFDTYIQTKIQEKSKRFNIVLEQKNQTDEINS